MQKATQVAPSQRTRPTAVCQLVWRLGRVFGQADLPLVLSRVLALRLFGPTLPSGERLNIYYRTC